MSENTILFALYRMGYHSKATGHGFRATASTILNEHGFSPDVIKRVGLCRASIYQRIEIGSFPRQISLGARAVGWLEHEIDGWLAARVSAARNRESV